MCAVMTHNFNAIFKAYDVRGTVPDQFDDDMARSIGAAFAKFVSGEDPSVGQVLVARDMRPSGEAMVAAFAEGVTSQGLDVVDLGLGSTDLLYFAAGTLDAPGAMFTASHNPAQYNGIKFCLSGARPVGEDSGLTQIRDDAAAGVAPAATTGTVTRRDVLEAIGGLDDDVPITHQQAAQRRAHERLVIDQQRAVVAEDAVSAHTFALLGADGLDKILVTVAVEVATEHRRRQHRGGELEDRRPLVAERRRGAAVEAQHHVRVEGEDLRYAVARDVEPASQHLHDEAVAACLPTRVRGPVASARHEASDWRVEEVVDVVDDVLAEGDARRAHGARFVDVDRAHVLAAEPGLKDCCSIIHATDVVTDSGSPTHHRRHSCRTAAASAP